jgi:hypothetical protein
MSQQPSPVPPVPASQTTDVATAVRLVQQVLDGLRSEVPVASAELLTALTRLREVRAGLAGWEPELAAAARDRGVSWADLAPALGVGSRQAAERRFLRLRPSSSGEATGEARVRAERDRRAGERAVASWARRNAASLRRLAAQVVAIETLPAAGRRGTARVQAALGDDDPATLLSPLADASAHLGEEHGQLAEQIRSVTDQTAQVRLDAARPDPAEQP